MSLVEVSNLSIGYERPLQQGLSFHLGKGEILQIKGGNGTGKSTLIKTISGEVKSLGGKIYWGIDKESVSTLPQVIEANIPLSLTMGEIFDIYGLEQSVINFYPTELLERRFNDASGGEKQKALILTRLTSKTKFLILDEPFNHLDKNAIVEIKAFLSELIASRVIEGIIVISHIDLIFDQLEVREVLLS